MDVWLVLTKKLRLDSVSYTLEKLLFRYAVLLLKFGGKEIKTNEITSCIINSEIFSVCIGCLSVLTLVSSLKILS